MLLLYSGGLDTSVMLKWIQERYGAEIVTLTVEPRAAGRGLGRRHRQGRAARGRGDGPRGRSRGVRERLRAAGDQGERALRRRLSALHRARQAADREARGRRRPASTAATRSPTAAPARATTRCGSRRRSPRSTRSCRIIAPVREWQMGREEEIAYAREHGIPVKGGTEVSPYSIDDNLWGRSSEGREIEDLDAAPPDDVFQLVTRPEDAPDEPQEVDGRLRARSSRLDRRRAARPGRAARAGGGDRRAPWRRHRRPHRGPGRRSQGARPLRGARRGDRADRPPRAREARLHDPPEQLQGRRSRISGRTSATPGSGSSRSRADLDAYMDSVNEFVTGEVSAEALPRVGDSDPAELARTPSTTARSHHSANPGETSPSTRARGSSSSSRCRAGWHTESERRTSDLRADRPSDRGIPAGAPTAARSASPPGPDWS